jgi:hypothetical protein
MELKDYFENNKGFGVLSTSDSNGHVNSAVFARPHVMEDGLLAFIMRDRQSYKNLQSNPRAIYLFREDGPGYKGVRLYLTKIREESDPDLITALSRRKYSDDKEAVESSVLVHFKLEKTRLLVGG